MLDQKSLLIMQIRRLKYKTRIIIPVKVILINLFVETNEDHELYDSNILQSYQLIKKLLKQRLIMIKQYLHKIFQNIRTIPPQLMSDMFFLILYHVFAFPNFFIQSINQNINHSFSSQSIILFNTFIFYEYGIISQTITQRIGKIYLRCNNPTSPIQIFYDSIKFQSNTIIESMSIATNLVSFRAGEILYRQPHLIVQVLITANYRISQSILQTTIFLQVQLTIQQDIHENQRVIIFLPSCLFINTIQLSDSPVIIIQFYESKSNPKINQDYLQLIKQLFYLIDDQQLLLCCDFLLFLYLQTLLFYEYLELLLIHNRISLVEHSIQTHLQSYQHCQNVEIQEELTLHDPQLYRTSR
ncbi:hypothetical protein pb186bvf_003181 [Paramecium bursaria]